MEPTGASTHFGPWGGAGGGIATACTESVSGTLARDTVLEGRWRVGGLLGQGGFGVVYEAHDLALDEPCAVKVLEADLGSPATADLDRFRGEVRALRRLSRGRRIVSVREYCESPATGRAILVMERTYGGTLAEITRGMGGKAPLPLVLRVCEQIMEGLALAHEHDIIHGDVTPSNILVAGASGSRLREDPDADPDLKLADFGLARLAGPSLHFSKNLGAGTLGYAAPEAYSQRGRMFATSDVYSAAAVVYELLVGQVPMVRFPDPSDVREDVPPWLERLLLWGLAYAPQSRPSASEAVAELRDRHPGKRRQGDRSHRSAAPSTNGPRDGDLVRDSRDRAYASCANRAPRRRADTPLEGLIELDPDSPWQPQAPAPEQLEAAEELGLPVAVSHVATGLPLALVPGGSFWMGAKDGDPDAQFHEGPRRRVLIDPFYLAVYPFPARLWSRVSGGPSRVAVRAQLEPVIAVSHDEIAAVLATSTIARDLRLPSESEWERAARGGRQTRYWWGDEFVPGLARCDDGDGSPTAPIGDPGSHPPNPYGLREVLGGLWEWVADPWHGDYCGAPDHGGVWRMGGDPTYRVVRGGAWSNGPVGVRAPARGRLHRQERYSVVTFRLARSIR